MALLPLLYFHAGCLEFLLCLGQGLIALRQIIALARQGGFTLLDSLLQLGKVGLTLGELLFGTLELLRGLGLLRLQLIDGLRLLGELVL
jgi:hypothetical protein